MTLPTAIAVFLLVAAAMFLGGAVCLLRAAAIIRAIEQLPHPPETDDGTCENPSCRNFGRADGIRWRR